MVAAAQGDALATLVAAVGAGAAFLCPNSELILVIAVVVLDTASAAPLWPAAPVAFAVAVPQGWFAAVAPFDRLDMKAEPAEPEAESEDDLAVS